MGLISVDRNGKKTLWGNTGADWAKILILFLIGYSLLSGFFTVCYLIAEMLTLEKHAIAMPNEKCPTISNNADIYLRLPATNPIGYNVNEQCFKFHPNGFDKQLTIQGQEAQGVPYDDVTVSLLTCHMSRGSKQLCPAACQSIGKSAEEGKPYTVSDITNKNGDGWLDEIVQQLEDNKKYCDNLAAGEDNTAPGLPEEAIVCPRPEQDSWEFYLKIFAGVDGKSFANGTLIEIADQRVQQVEQWLDEACLVTPDEVTSE